MRPSGSVWLNPRSPARSKIWLGHDLRVVRVAPEVFDGFFPGAKELREMFQYFEAHTYFGPDAQTAIATANALVPTGFTGFSEWARKNMQPSR